MQTKSLPAILGGSGRRVASEVAANTHLVCVLLNSAPAVAQVLVARAMLSLCQADIVGRITAHQEVQRKVA